MPELPEVQTVVNSLQSLVNQRIVSVHLMRPDIVKSLGDLKGLLQSHSIRSITRRAKRIIFTLDTGRVFYIHLGMTGRLTLESPATLLLPHTHLIVQFNYLQLRFRDPRRFGGIFILT